jgi:putative transposase
MKRKRFSEEQIIGFLREAWKAKFGAMNVSEAQRLKSLEAENAKLKKLLANSMLEIDAMREVLRGK